MYLLLSSTNFSHHRNYLLLSTGSVTICYSAINEFWHPLLVHLVPANICYYLRLSFTIRDSLLLSDLLLLLGSVISYIFLSVLVIICHCQLRSAGMCSQFLVFVLTDPCLPSSQRRRTCLAPRGPFYTSANPRKRWNDQVKGESPFRQTAYKQPTRKPPRNDPKWNQFPKVWENWILQFAFSIHFCYVLLANARGELTKKERKTDRKRERKKGSLKQCWDIEKT